MLQPLRLGPLVIPLVFFLQLVRRVRELAAREAGAPWWRRRSVVLAAVGIVVAVTDHLADCSPRRAWSSAPSTRGSARDDDADAFRWIAGHTPHVAALRRARSIGRTPTSAPSARRGTWQAIRYDDVRGWKRRVDALVGGPGFFGADDHAADLGELRAAYDRLSAAQIVAVARQYHAGCIVASTRYPLPVLHRSGGTRIYRVPATGAP